MNLNNSQTKPLSDKQLPIVQEPLTPTKKSKEDDKTNYVIQQKLSMKANKIPNLFTLNNNKNSEIIEKDDNFIKSKFKGGSLNLDEFLNITTNLLEFPKMLNKLLFNKIDVEKSNQITQTKYLK